MLFSDQTFFVFFAVYLTLHFIVPPRWRIYLIIAGSTVFYAWWRVIYVWLPYTLTLIAWAGTLWFTQVKEVGSRRQRLIVTIVALFAPLAIFKYASFIINGVFRPALSGWIAVPNVSFLNFTLPLGISFVTFTLTAYVVDVYRGRFRVERSLVKMLGYVLFFPHLIAGPILRPHELLPQLSHLRRALGARFTLGVALFAVGLVKKVVFADTIAALVDHVYHESGAVSGWEYLLAIHGFSMQIYCDFSGYTDMAIGLAYILRIRLPTNFRRPYISSSIVEFWRCWHITLSFWLRDYLYIPLGGNRQGRSRQMLNLLITMVLGGLWHGAAWTFVIWGTMHGAALAGVHLFRRFQDRGATVARSAPNLLLRDLRLGVFSCSGLGDRGARVHGAIDCAVAESGRFRRNSPVRVAAAFHLPFNACLRPSRIGASCRRSIEQNDRLANHRPSFRGRDNGQSGQFREVYLFRLLRRLVEFAIRNLLSYKPPARGMGEGK